MKVLFLPKWYPNINDVQHGIFIKNQALALAKKTPVAVLFVVTSELVKEEKTEINRQENYLEVIVYFRKRPNRLLGLYSYYQSFKKGVAVLEKEWGRPDVSLLYILGRNYMMYKKFFSDVPFVISEQWSGYLNGKMEKYIYAKRKNTLNALRRSSAMIAVSEPLADALRKYSGREEVVVIPNIVKSVSLAENHLGDPIKILSVADLDDSIKNISGIFQALAKVVPAYQIHYRIIGEGMDADRLKALAESISGPHLKIEFVRRMPHEELLKQYAWCNFYILNSYSETFNVAAAESCAAGRPVISTRCGGPERFINENNGVLIEVDDQNQLAEAISTLIEKLKSGMLEAKTVANTINQTFGEEAIASQYLKVLSEALDKKNLSSIGNSK